MIGQHVGPYLVVAQLGQGGMGVVYRGTDSRLARDVALKVLPESVANDPDRLARFKREAQVLASLNHPHIGAIYGLEEAGAARCLVLELVEGPTLAEQLGAGPLSIEDALRVARQIGEALEAAHEKGIVHRDLKPANVKVRPDGAVKVLDFGLAKPLIDRSPAGTPALPEGGPTPPGGTPATPGGTPVAPGGTPGGAFSPTVTSGSTRAGFILGTAAYMSPEQARGRPVDRRTDIWAFGCVLYEMLTGRLAFGGDTLSDSIARILERDVDWTRLPANTPASIRELLRRCLEKDAKRRLRDIGDAVLVIDDVLAARGWSSSGVTVPPTLPGDRSWMRRAVVASLLVLAGVAAGLAFAVFAPLLKGTASDQPATRLHIVIPDDLRVRLRSLSPDGQTLVMIASTTTGVGQAQSQQAAVYARRLDRFQVERLSGTDGATDFAFSPDGRSLAFVAPVTGDNPNKRRLARVPVDGSLPPTTVLAWGDDWEDFCWLPGGDFLVFSGTERRTFRRVPQSGGAPGTPTKVSSDPQFQEFRNPTTVSDRAVFIEVYGYSERGYHMNIAVIDLESGKLRMVMADARLPHLAPTGHLLFTRQDSLLAAPFDVGRLETTGPPTAIASGLKTYAGTAAWFDVATNGTLVYEAGGRVGSRRRLVIVDRTGTITPWSEERRPFEQGPRVSLDGRRVAVFLMNAADLWEVWGGEVASPGLRRLIAMPGGDSAWPVWSADGERLVHTRWAQKSDDGIYVIAANGRSPARLLVRIERDAALLPSSWSPDESTVLAVRGSSSGPDLFMIQLGDTGGTLKPLLVTEFWEDGGMFSPDGRHIAYASNESGRFEVYVAPFLTEKSLGRSVVVSRGGGRSPLWSHDGRSIIYLGANEGAMTTPVTTSPALSAGTPAALFGPEMMRKLLGWDILPDGRFIAVQKGEDEGETRTMNVAFDWFDELKTRIGDARR